MRRESGAEAITTPGWITKTKPGSLADRFRFSLFFYGCDIGNRNPKANDTNRKKCANAGVLAGSHSTGRSFNMFLARSMSCSPLKGLTM
jgi:hypothetical protein